MQTPTRRTALLAALLVASSAVLSTSAAHADDIDDLKGVLGERVVSGASKASESARDAPATTATLTAADIRRYGIRSLDEAIDFLGMGLVTQNPLHSVEIGGRGVLLTNDYGNHVLVVVDGHALNEGWDGTTYFEQGAAIPMELIDHIELILGAGSVLYGGNAMLAVVNVVTKAASSYKGVHLIADGFGSPAYGVGSSIRSFAPSDLGGSYRFGIGIGHEFTLFGSKAELTGQVEYYGQSGPSFDWAPQRAFSSQTDASGNPLPYNFGPGTQPGVWGGRSTRSYWTQVPAAHLRFIVGDFTLMLRAASYARATPYLNGFNQQVGDFDNPNNHETDRWLQADLAWRRRFSEQFAVSARLYGDSYDYQQPLYSSEPTVCRYSLGGPCIVDAIGVSRWAGLELQATQDWFGDDRLVTMLGVDGRVRFVGAKTDNQDAASGRELGSAGAAQATETPAAAYLQQRWSPWKWMHLNLGARFDHDPRGGDRLSPRAAIVLDPWRGGAFKLIYAEAFRAPTLYEATYVDTNQIPNPNLHAETVRSAEASLEQRWGAQRILFGIFRTWWSDMISLDLVDATAQVSQYRNSRTIDNYGYNGLLEGSLGDLRYGLSVTGAWTRRQTADGSESLPVSPSLFGNARVSYDLPGSLPIVALAATLVGPRLADRGNDSGYPTVPMAPTQVQLRLTVSDRIPGIDALWWRIGANYATSGVAAYVAGPNQHYTPGVSPESAALAPVQRFSVFGSLQWDIPL